MATHSSILAWRIPLTEEPIVHGVSMSQTQLNDQLEWKIALPWANTRGILNSPSSLENPAATREKPRGSPVIAR